MQSDESRKIDKMVSGLKRIDRKYISDEISALLNLEKGFLFTLKNLLIRPGKSVREFLFEDRKKYAKPLVFLILMAVVFMLILRLFEIPYSFISIEGFNPKINATESLHDRIRAQEIGGWLNRNMGYAQLIMGLFIGFWIKILFRRFRYNIYEILILLAFIFGEGFFILTCFIFIGNLFNGSVFVAVGFLIYFLYIFWGIGQFFGERKVMNYIKSFLAYALGTVSYLGSQIVVAYLIRFIEPVAA